MPSRKVQLQKEWKCGTMFGVVTIQHLLLSWRRFPSFELNRYSCLFKILWRPLVEETGTGNDWFFIKRWLLSSCFHIYFVDLKLGLVLQDGAAVTGLAIAAGSLVAVNTTGNPMYDPIGSIIVGNLLGMVWYLSSFISWYNFPFITVCNGSLFRRRKKAPNKYLCTKLVTSSTEQRERYPFWIFHQVDWVDHCNTTMAPQCYITHEFWWSIDEHYWEGKFSCSANCIMNFFII